MKKIVVSIIALALVLSAMAAMAQDKSYTITPKIAYGYVVDSDSRDLSGATMGILVEGNFESIPVGFETGYLFNDESCALLGTPGKYKAHQVPILATYKQPFSPENPFYFNVGAGISINEYKWKDTAGLGVSVSESKTRFAYKVGVGYKFAESFVAELSYADYGKSDAVGGIKTGQVQLALGYSF